MKKILFCTGNPRKVREAQEACEPHSIQVQQANLSINEIQSYKPIEITKHKVEQAFSLLGQPVVVNDSSWSIPALNGFPGGYMKDVDHWFAPEDFIQLINRHENREIKLIECIFYQDANHVKSFLREFTGEISKVPRGISGSSIEKVVIFNGKTIAEHHDQGSMAFQAEDFIWHDFAGWYIRNKQPLRKQHDTHS